MQIRLADEAKLTQLWNDCQLDRDIAERLGNYKSRDISNYRRDNDMPSNIGLLTANERGVSNATRTKQRTPTQTISNYRKTK